MSEHSLQDLTGRELQFCGDLILEREKQIDMSDEHSRTFAVRLYGVEGGGFVPMIEFSTSCPDENAVRTFENVDLMKDVECFFLVFEANEVLRESRKMSRQDAGQRSADCRRLAKQFESLVFPFLDDVRELAESQGFRDKPEEKKKSLWKLLG